MVQVELSLRATGLIKVTRRARSFVDGRRLVDIYIYDYAGNDGEVYRKSFETTPDISPRVPVSGTHKSINDRKVQW